MSPVVWRIDPDKHLYIRVFAQEQLKVLASLILEVFFNRILKVNDDPVGAAGQCLGYAFRAGSWDEERTADGRINK